MSVLAIDAGTTGVTAVVVTADGRIAARGYQEFAQHFPKPGWVEHAPEEIWQATARGHPRRARSSTTPRSCRRSASPTSARRSCCGTARPSAPPGAAIVWQDRRTADICTRLRDEGHEDRVTELTGLRLDPYFSGTKLMWLAENEPHTWALVESGRYAVGTVDSYLIARMTRGTWHVTDVSNACRTLLFDLASRRLVRRAVRPVRRTPRRAARSWCPTGARSPPPTRRRSAAWSCPSPASPATSSRRCSARPASTWATPSAPTAPARSSSPTPAPTLERSDAGLLSTAAWRSPDGELTYALEGAIFVTGAAVQWLRDGLQIVGSAAETAAIAATVDDTEGVVFVPGADRPRRPALGPARPRPDHRHHPRHHPRPHRPGDAGGDRLRGARRPRDDARARPARPLRVDGGAAANDLLCQIQADQVGVPVERPKIVETTALGAAFLAGLGTGVWSSTDDLRETWQLDRRFEPAGDRDAADAAHARWIDAVEPVEGLGDRLNGWRSSESAEVWTSQAAPGQRPPRRGPWSPRPRRSASARTSSASASSSSTSSARLELGHLPRSSSISAWSCMLRASSSATSFAAAASASVASASRPSAAASASSACGARLRVRVRVGYDVQVRRRRLRSGWATRGVAAKPSASGVGHRAGDVDLAHPGAPRAVTSRPLRTARRAALVDHRGGQGGLDLVGDRLGDLHPGSAATAAPGWSPRRSAAGAAGSAPAAPRRRGRPAPRAAPRRPPAPGRPARSRAAPAG